MGKPQKGRTSESSQVGPVKYPCPTPCDKEHRSGLFQPTGTRVEELSAESIGQASRAVGTGAGDGAVGWVIRKEGSELGLAF